MSFEFVDRQIEEGLGYIYTVNVNTGEWNGCDGSGAVVSSGVYFYRIAFGKEKITRKVVLLSLNFNR